MNPINVARLPIAEGKWGFIRPTERLSGELTRAQYDDDRIRSRIEHEDELINLRVVRQLLRALTVISIYTALSSIDSLRRHYEDYFTRSLEDKSTRLFPAL